MTGRARIAGGPNRGSRFRPADDFYPTMPSAIEPFLDAHELLPGRVWDPACGQGGIVRALRARGREVVATNLEDRGCGETGIDFLMELSPLASVVVCNPPFSLDTEFAVKGVALGLDEMALFLKTKFLAGAERYETLMGPHPPAFVYQFIERITFYAGDVDVAEQPGWNTEDFAWFVWRRGFEGEPRVRWLHRG